MMARRIIAGHQAAGGGSSGTQLYHGFDDDPLDQLPAWLVPRWNPPASSWRVLESSLVQGVLPDYGARTLFTSGNAISYKRVALEVTGIDGTPADTISALLFITNDPACIPQLIVRGNGDTDGSRTGYSLWCRPGSGNLQIKKTVSGAESTLASGTLSYSSSGDHIAALSAELIGGSLALEASIYPIENEGLKTTLTATDSSPLSAGWLAIGSASSDTTYIRWGWVGVGTDGAPAPMEPI